MNITTRATAMRTTFTVVEPTRWPALANSTALVDRHMAVQNGGDLAKVGHSGFLPGAKAHRRYF